MENRVVGKAAALVAMLIAGGQAMAQNDRPLSGPPVRENRPNLEGGFVDGAGGDKFAKRDPMGERPIPMRAYMQIVNRLRGDGAPDGLALTPQQSQKIDAILDEFRQNARPPAERGRGQQDGAPSRPPAGGDQPPPPAGKGKGDARPERPRVEELRRATDYEIRMYAVLTHEQQRFVDAEAQKVRAEMEQRAGEEYMRRQVEKRRPEAGKPGAPNVNDPRPAGAPDPAIRERVQRVLERIRQLPPDQREQILERLERELDRREAAGADPTPRPPPRGGETPADNGVSAPPPPRPK